MINEPTWKYVREHLGGDVRTLALHGCKDDAVDMTMALQQIDGHQRALRKLPSWAATEGVVYPPRINMEQCSGELAARHKAKIIGTGAAGALIDLTGGLGVDFTFMCDVFKEAVYVERDARLCAVATHNLRVLGKRNTTTVCSDARDYLATIPPQADTQGRHTVIYLDPSRRDTHGRRTYALADCTPDVADMMPALLLRADMVMLKLSPMLDWRKAVADLSPHTVHEVHIVSVDNECKELLLLLRSRAAFAPHPLLTCSDICSADGSCLDYSPGMANSAPAAAASTAPPHAIAAATAPPPAIAAAGRTPLPAFLYEPNAAVMKAGCYSQVASDFGVSQIAPNSHLYVSDRAVPTFPGRRFRIADASTMNRRELSRSVGRLKRANISVRNFPLGAEQLRQRLGIADGGTDHIFATTLADGTHILLLCQRDR